MREKKTVFSRSNKFDIQLGQARGHEERLAGILNDAKIELKTESWLWERTGNIAIEYRQHGKPSGISVTEADYWMHELRKEDQTVVYFMFPMEQLKRIVREEYRRGNYRTEGGDGGGFSNVLLRLKDLHRMLTGA